MKKWYSVLMALFLAFAMLVVSSGCGKDAKKDSASTTATSQESLEQIFKENAQKNLDKNIPFEEVYTTKAPTSAFMSTPDFDGTSLLIQARKDFLADSYKLESMTVSNIQLRDTLMAADITATATLTTHNRQKKTDSQSGKMVLRKEHGVWKQLPFGVVEVMPIKSIEVVSGGMRNVSVYGNIGKFFSGEHAIFLSFKNNGTTNYSMGWVNPPVISAITDTGEVISRSLPQYGVKTISDPILLRNETRWMIIAFPEAKGTIREIKFTDFHVLNPGGLPSETFEHPILTLHLTM